MSKVNVKHKEVVVGVTLELSLEEAAVIKILLGGMCGDPHTSLRCVTKDVYDELSKIKQISRMYSPEFFTEVPKATNDSAALLTSRLKEA